LFSNSTSFLISILTQLFLVYIISTNWSLAGLGFWVLCNSFIAYSMLASNSLVECFSNYVSNKINNDIDILSYYKLVGRLQLISFVAISSIIIFSFFFYDWLFLYSPEKIAYSNNTITHPIILYFSLLILSFFSIKFNQLLILSQYYNLVHFHLNISSLLKIIETILISFLILLNIKIEIIFCSLILIKFLILIIFNIILYNKTKLNLRGNFDNLKINKILVIRGGIAANVLINLINILTNQVILLIIGNKLGLDFVGLFSVVRTYSRFLLKISSILNNSFIPIIAKGLYLKTIKKYNKSSIILIALLHLLFIIISFKYSKQVLYFWTGSSLLSNNFDDSLIIIFIVESFSLSLFYLFLNKFIASNSHLRYVLSLFLLITFILIIFITNLITDVKIIFYLFISSTLLVNYFIYTKLEDYKNVS
jgi:O-antigen/teichoic acid export membrane protein